MEPKRRGNWSADRHAERDALRRDFPNTTPGQRMEEAIVLSRELTDSVDGRHVAVVKHQPVPVRIAEQGHVADARVQGLAGEADPLRLKLRP